MSISFQHLKRILIVVVISLLPVALLSQSDKKSWHYALPQEIHTAINANKAEDILPLLNNFVEIATPMSNGIFSSSQAKVVVREFFSNVIVSRYSIEHERSMGDATLTIGSLRTSSADYHIYFLTKKTEESVNIQQIKIEEKK